MKTKNGLSNIKGKMMIVGNLLFILLLAASCKNNGSEHDASGYFEAVETVVSAQGNGQLIAFDVQEGQQLVEGQKVGQIDSTQISLSLKQVQAQRGAILSRKPDISSQTAVLKTQISAAERELNRVENLYNGNAATRKQLDDARSQVKILRKQLDAQRTALSQSSTSVSKESNPLDVQIALLKDQLNKARIINPVSGTVLVKYVEKNELVSAGKPLYKIADMSNLILRAYVPNKQLVHVSVGQSVKVMVEQGDSEHKTYTGTVIWISKKSEFTPKTIQTKDERANEVYAVKISVPSDGYLRLGMYAELKFSEKTKEK